MGRSPGDWATFYECLKYDKGHKGFPSGYLTQIILVGAIGLGMSLHGLFLDPKGKLGRVEILAGLAGLVIVGFIVKGIW